MNKVFVFGKIRWEDGDDDGDDDGNEDKKSIESNAKENIGSFSHSETLFVSVIPKDLISFSVLVFK